MHTQLLNLYTLKQYLQHKQIGHISVYITPSGNIFDCKHQGAISHCRFTEEFYKNYKRLITQHTEIDFDTEVSEFILDDDNFSLTDIRDFYKDQFYDIQYTNPKVYNLIVTNYLAIDNLLVQDLGFVKVSINRGELPAIMLPMKVFNNKTITAEQYNSLVSVLENNTISYQDFNTKRLIKLREKELRDKSNEIESLLLASTHSY